MALESTPSVALDEAIRRAGSQRALARLVGLTQQAVHGWVSGKRRVPPEHVLKVEAATGISRHELRPDIYPLDLPSAHAPGAAEPAAANPNPPAAAGTLGWRT